MGRLESDMVEIYIPGKKKDQDLGASLPDIDELPDELPLLEELEKTESDKVFHLERSNRELLEALEVEEDRDFREAVDENKLIIEKKQVYVDRVRDKIKELKAAQVSIRPGVDAAPVRQVGPQV